MQYIDPTVNILIARETCRQGLLTGKFRAWLFPCNFETMQPCRPPGLNKDGAKIQVQASADMVSGIYQVILLSNSLTGTGLPKW